MSKKVTQFPGTYRPPEPPRMVYSTMGTSGKCMHWPVNYTVDEAAGTVMCRDCGESLNPIWVLKQVYFLVEDERKRRDKKRRK